MNGALPHAQIREEAQEEADFLAAAEAANNNCSGKIGGSEKDHKLTSRHGER